MTPITTEYETPSVENGRIRWIVTKSASGADTYCVRKWKDGTQTVEQSGIASLKRAKAIADGKVVMYRAWSKK